ncbi:MAG: NERD domain-containing protein [Parasporobacterium sp.]|nr:NERD domain-containing protein [Parasporobacterium sp.]
MTKGLFDLLLDSIFDEEWKGRRGEKLTARELKLVNFFGRDGRTLRNVYVPTSDGKTSEIDLLYITRKGIFVFESKNYSGWVFGDERGKYWTVMLPNREKNKLFNPIIQNNTHIKWLRAYIGDNVPLFSIIVFSERCELKKVPENTSTVKIIKRDRTYATVRDIWDESVDALSEEEVENVYLKLKELTNVDAATKAAHIENIRRKTTISKSIREEDTDTMICPQYGGKLILRTAKKGNYTGNQFYGCSNFPRCRYIKNQE